MTDSIPLPSGEEEKDDPVVTMHCSNGHGLTAKASELAKSPWCLICAYQSVEIEAGAHQGLLRVGEALIEKDATINALRLENARLSDALENCQRSVSDVLGETAATTTAPLPKSSGFGHWLRRRK